MDATIAAVSLYKDDDLKEVDSTLPVEVELKDYNIQTSDAMKDDFENKFRKSMLLL